MLLLGISLLGTSAYAQATRTWVSGVGDDANPCSRTAPCKTFAGAISKTAPGGVIDALDPGGFGAVTITKSITIQGDGVIAGVLVSGTNGIVVSAGVNDVVTLRNLLFEGLGTGLQGIRFINGKALIVENCSIVHFSGNGIDFNPSGTGSALMVKDSNLQQNVTGGILVHPQVGANARATLDHVRLEKNGYGLRVESNASAAVRNSLSTENTTNGYLSVSTGAGPSDMAIDNSSATYNTNNGVRSDGSTSTIRISNMFVFGNGSQGLSIANSGHNLTFGNNNVVDTGTAETGPITPQ